VIEPSQDFPFRQKTTDHIVSASASLHQLDRYLFSEAPVGTRCQIDGSHSSFADFLKEQIGSNPAPDERRYSAWPQRSMFGALLQRINLNWNVRGIIPYWFFVQHNTKTRIVSVIWKQIHLG
jgi:hypothetical protein